MSKSQTIGLYRFAGKAVVEKVADKTDCLNWPGQDYTVKSR